MNTIHARFEAQVQQTPSAIAVEFDDLSLTWQSLNHRANVLAGRLQTLGVTPDMQIALCMERSLEQIITILGILKAGCAYLPLDSTQPIARLNMILSEGGVSILIIHSDLQQQFNDYQGQFLFIDQENVTNPLSRDLSDGSNDLSSYQDQWIPLTSCETTVKPVSVVKPNNLAYVIYTSGSTGVPKGVLIEHQTVINYCRWFADYSGAHAQQRIDWSGNYIFDMTVSTSIVPLMLGLTVVMCSDEIKKDVPAFLRYLKTKKINVVKISPSYFKELLREATAHFIELPDLQTIVLGGENLRAVECQGWLNLYPKHTLFNEYGPTEATVAVTQQKICRANIDSFQVNVPIGKPGTNMNCYILNEQNEPVMQGFPGELYIGGLCLARGYLNHPELTAEKFISYSVGTDEVIRLYKTGDVCRQLQNGVIEYLGRIDTQVKIRGYRIELGEIEYGLCTHHLIHDAVVIAHEDRLIAYYILKNRNQPLNPSQLRKYLRNHMADYMIPSCFIPMESFPLTANGKLDHHALPSPSLSNRRPSRAPRSGIEKKLMKIWSDELGVDSVGTHDNFYELGGHSLNAARIVSKINSEFKKSISLKDFYHADTIAALTKVIKKSAEKSSRDVKIQSSFAINKIRLSDFQLLLWLSNTFEPKARKLNVISRKRWQGPLNHEALTYAFRAVIKRHDILNYQISTFYPAQSLKLHHEYNVMESWLADCSPHESERVLLESLNQLVNFNDWSKSHSSVMAKLFYLSDDEVELQICLPHLIADEMSLSILWRDLSKYYDAYQTPDDHARLADDPVKSFNDYILTEQQSMTLHFEDDYSFWRHYLSNTELFSFPPESVVNDMHAQGLKYSTYQAIPMQALLNLEQHCAEYHIAPEVILCAAVSIALRNIKRDSQNTTRSILMNIVKSTREDPVYDETIGCFVRVDPIKVCIDDQQTVLSVAEQIHHTMIEHANYMRASSIMKLACLAETNGKRSMVFITQWVVSAYAKLLKLFNLHYNVLNLVAYLSSFNRKNNFIICINIWNNFILSKQDNIALFGLKPKTIQMHQYDISSIDNIFDVSFLRDDSQKTPYLVISSNLDPAIREQIAKEVIHVLHETVVGMQTKEGVSHVE